MRKLFWCCAGAGVLAGGLMLAALQACRHPDSFVSRCAVAASGVTVLINPAGVAGPVAERLLQVWHPEGAGEESAAREPDEEAIPDDPIPAPEPAGVAEAPPPPAGPEKPAAGPAPIVIPEEDPEPVAAGPRPGAKEAETGAEHDVPTPPSAREMSAPQAGTGAGEPAEESVAVPARTGPMTMPYCADEEVSPGPMPYATDRVEEPAEARQEEITQHAWRFLKDLFRTKTPGKAAPEGSTKRPGSDPVGAPDCREDRHHHEQAPACPCTGCSHATTPRACQRRPPVTDSGEEESEEPGPRKTHGQTHPFKDGEGDEGCPAHPEVDTMEFRPSDAHLYDWGPGPL
jgi:hypothetical protein